MTGAVPVLVSQVVRGRRGIGSGAIPYPVPEPMYHSGIIPQLPIPLGVTPSETIPAVRVAAGGPRPVWRRIGPQARPTHPATALKGGALTGTRFDSVCHTRQSIVEYVSAGRGPGRAGRLFDRSEA